MLQSIYPYGYGGTFDEKASVCLSDLALYIAIGILCRSPIRSLPGTCAGYGRSHLEIAYRSGNPNHDQPDYR